MKNTFIVIACILCILTITYIAGSEVLVGNNVVDQHKEFLNENLCDKNDDEFCTHLPLVTINTNDKEIPYENVEEQKIITEVKIIDNKSGGNHLDDKADVKSLANIRYRGNSSLAFDKKGYLLKFIHEDESENKVKVMGMQKHDEWVLHGPFLDKTLLRNYLWYHISGKIMNSAPDSRFCELYVNDEYKGVYLMVESPTRGDKSRIQVSKYKKGDPYTSYIVRLDKGTTNPLVNINSFSQYTYNNMMKWDIIYPGKNIINEELNEYIRKDISSFEKALYSYDYDSKRYGYEKYIDVDSFVNYYIINEFTQNYDAGNMSTYLYKDVKGKFGLYVWDFNNANNNYQVEIKLDDFQFQWNTWYFMLMKDERFTNKIIKRYRYLRSHYLSDEYLLGYIDDVVKYLDDSIDRNFEVWGYTFEKNSGLLIPDSRNTTSYEEAIEDLKKHIVERGKFMDKHIETIKQFSHESKIKKFNH